MLGSRAFDLLLALIDTQGRLATKDELIAKVWANSVVDENNLAAQVSTLRKVLSRDAAMATCLQTVPGRGYRFVADVTEESLDNEVQGAVEVDRTGNDALSLVVLPFRNLSSDRDQAYFANGLSHTIATDLSRISGLLVISSSTAATFEDRHIDARDVSRELSIRYVLTGSVQRSNDQIRINAQLVDGRTGLQVASERLDGDSSDLFALQDRITGRIANSIGREIFVAAARDGESRNIDPRSFDLVMRGIAADNQPQTLQVLREQEALFARAAVLDPSHGDALARLARALLLQVTQAHSSSPNDQALASRGIDAAERAVALEPGNARAHYAMGLVHVLRSDFERSVLANEAAITLDRNFALAHNNIGNSFVHLGRGHDALVAVERALRLDPRGPQLAAFWTTQGFSHLLIGKVDEAMAGFDRARAANPKLPRAQVGAAISLALGGHVEAARQAAAELKKLVPSYRLSNTMDGCAPQTSPAYRDFYERVLSPGATLAGLPV